MAVNKVRKSTEKILYFYEQGKVNLPELVQALKKVFGRREDLRACKIVVFTAHGEGAYLAFTKLVEFAPRVVAVTFPPTFAMKRGEAWFHPQVNENMRNFFKQVGVTVLVPQSLPFDPIAGMEGHNQSMKLVKQSLDLFGGGFSLCVQAVLRACDAGLVEPGEMVVAFSGDTAALVRASPTSCFLLADVGLEIVEILCKHRNTPIAAPWQEEVVERPALENKA